jgi:threonine/homoserine/homoserine lactone efflux protein
MDLLCFQTVRGAIKCVNEEKILMTLESILAFSLAMFILAVTPGPGVFASVSQALSSGFRSSLDLIAGIVVGDLVFLLLAVFGLSAMAHILGELFFIIKLLGGAYLIWLGWKMWTMEPMVFNSNQKFTKHNGWQRFLGGLFLTLGNPKVILFYAGFLPTFIDLSRLKTPDIAVVAGLVSIILSGVLGIYSFTASRAIGLFKSNRAACNFNRSAGTVLIGTGVIVVTR